MSELIKHITDASYEEDVLQADKPVVVDFWAPWCGPCRMLEPIMEQLAKEYEGKIIFTKLNTDENMDVATRLGIRGIPTVIIYWNGQEEDRLVGYAPKPVLKRRLDAVLAKAEAG
ncbi:MAG: thioredoxin [Anaerolineae bacterium]|nr:thioredoxin [Anaerolineae bacterium]